MTETPPTSGSLSPEARRLAAEAALKAMPPELPSRTPTTSPIASREDILDLARRAVTGARRGAYGPPENNFRRIATLWNAHLRAVGILESRDESREIRPEDVAILMVLMKVARLQETPFHLDSIVDIAGYAACLGEMVPPPSAAL